MKKQAWKRASWTVTTQHEERSRGERAGGEVTLKLNNEHEREGDEVKLQNNKHENTSLHKSQMNRKMDRGKLTLYKSQAMNMKKKGNKVPIYKSQTRNIILMEICKCPTYQNISTAQGLYTSKNSDMQEHKKITKIHIHLLHSTHTQTGTHASIQTSQQEIGVRWGGVGGTIGSGNKDI